ncbi:MAG: winged helix-turn-helix transcriptional regulator [Deltaproteobacteria bacterium]|nr:winged helix-turn-helix transcriptional regulator [Deltaproteobacteria bacterium]
MVDYSSSSLDRSLYALSDPTRRAILARIAQGETSVSELAKPFDMSLAAVSKHLQVLERAHFLKKTKSGRTITCRATLSPLAEVRDLLEDLGRYWNQQLDSLEKFLASNADLQEETHGNKNKSATNARNSTRHPGKKR